MGREYISSVRFGVSLDGYTDGTVDLRLFDINSNEVIGLVEKLDPNENEHIKSIISNVNKDISSDASTFKKGCLTNRKELD